MPDFCLYPILAKTCTPYLHFCTCTRIPHASDFKKEKLCLQESSDFNHFSHALPFLMHEFLVLFRCTSFLCLVHLYLHFDADFTCLPHHMVQTNPSFHDPSASISSTILLSQLPSSVPPVPPSPLCFHKLNCTQSWHLRHPYLIHSS